MPVLPEAVPGAAVSPGTKSCTLENDPAVMLIEGLVLAVFELSVMSLAVTVAVPTVLSVTLMVFVPATKATFAGKTALLSEEVSPTVSATPLIKFQLASTALTVTLKGPPAVCDNGVPVLPFELPGAAVSPGTSSCNLAKTPALTEIEALVLAVLLPSLASVAVTVRLPAVLSVTLKVWVPEIKAAFAGSVALLSEELIPTVSAAFVTRFQLASTAFTVMLKAVPAT